MAVFAIDKRLDDAIPPDSPLNQTIDRSILSQFDYQAPQSPEGKQRMMFRNLKTVDGGSLPDVEFFIDPQSIQVSKRVIQRKQLTKGGFVIQFWGHELTQIQANAITGNFQPIYGVEVQLPSNSQAKARESWFNQVRERWARGGGPLKIFEKIKDWVYQKRFSEITRYQGFPNIELVYEDFIYEGYLTDFRYNLQSSQPFNISFNFTFMVTRRRDMSLEDVFGSIDIIDLAGDPLVALQNKVKQTTSIITSKAEKELGKLADKIPHLGNTNLTKNLFDGLPNKTTLW